ncbi:uncharacterized protein [Choristoneura fumiferana]|uniref:uncharacterized protein n=1 Tax=Choristoneura fumiferana TaxID=7141 RepID=UPI003D159B92
MVARAALALVALGAILRTSAQPTSALVYVKEEDPSTNDVEDIEKRYTPELVAELQSAKDDALLLYTEYTGQAGADLKVFLKEMAGMMEETRRSLEGVSAPPECRSTFDDKLADAVYAARRSASFSAENHHKFLLGHMIVFRMHLNKSEDYINKCDRVFKDCGLACETTPRVTRWRRFAMQEINRVRDDLQHSRRSYHDLLAHAHRKLNHLRKRAKAKTTEAVEELKRCAGA